MTRVPPRTKLPLTYTQTVYSPYAISMMPDGLRLDDIMSLEEAVHEFVRYCLPPLQGRTAVITDVDGVAVLGYTHNPFAEEALKWVGTKAAVEFLGEHRLIEPLLIASIEMALEPAS